MFDCKIFYSFQNYTTFYISESTTHRIKQFELIQKGTFGPFFWVCCCVNSQNCLVCQPDLICINKARK